MCSRWAAVVSTAVLTLWAADAAAVGTRSFVLDSLDSFEGGDLAGVSIASDGSVRAGWTLGAAPIADASSVWSAIVTGDSALLGTGTGGRIYQVKGGTVSIAAETGQMAVSSLAVAFGGDIGAGTFPEGKLYRVSAAALGATETLKPWLELPDTEDVWALAFDKKNKALYAATGPEGKLYRIDERGNAEVFFDSEDPHLVSVTVSADGTVYSGSNGKALLYKVTAPGRADVVFDFAGDDVKAIQIGSDGSLFAISNEYRDAFKGVRPKRSRVGTAAGPTTNKKPKPGKGKLMRFSPGGVAELMLEDDDTHFVSLALDGNDVAHVGTGAEGKVYSVDDGHVERLLADTEERQVGAMVLGGKIRFVATTDPVVFHEITGEGGADAVWTSKVLDAGLRAHFGLLQWRADGTLELQTRSGNTEKPDNSWSAWSAAQTQSGAVQSPAARFLQIRARWGRDPAAVLFEVKASFVTDNARALLTDVTAGESQTDSGSDKVPESGGPLDKPSEELRIKWKVENPDNDTLRYRVFYRPLGDRRWIAITDPNEQQTKTDLSWDTTGIPEGRYRIRVDASDELSNPPGRVSKHSLESRTVLVDNTPPSLTKLTLRGRRLQGTAIDGLGPIARIEVALLGSKTWWPAFPIDQVFDQRTESFEVDLSTLIPPDAQLVVVRAYDAAGNRIERTISSAP